MSVLTVESVLRCPSVLDTYLVVLSRVPALVNAILASHHYLGRAPTHVSTAGLELLTKCG